MAYIPSGITSIVSTVPSNVLVGASIFGSIPPSSVLVLNPVSVLAVNASPASVQVLNPVSILATTQSGIRITSVISSTPSSMLVGASVFGNVGISGTPNVNVAGSVVAFQSNPSVLQVLAGLMSTNASIITTGGTTGNSSVQVLNFPTTQNVSGSVASYPLGTIITSLVSTVPSSIIVGASIFGLPPVNVTNTNLNVSGSVAAWLQSTNASVITVGTAAANQSVSGTVDAAQISTWRVSVVSSTPSSMLVGTSVFGNIGISGTPNVNTAGSVVAFQSNPSVLQVLAGLMSTNASIITAGGTTGNSSVQVLNFPTTQNISGSVASFPLGTIITSLVSTIPSSVIVGASIFGQLPAGTAPLGSIATLQGTNPWIVSNSVQLLNSPNAIGSVTALQGTNPWVINFANSSILAVPVSSVITAFSNSPSIVGTYAEDIAHTTADKGVFVLGVRNDALSSITSANLDYSPHAVGPTGETIATIAPFTKGIQGTGDLRVVQGASVTVIVAQGASIYSYIRAAQLANMGSASVLVTFGGGLGSILSYSIAPAGGGSNIKFDPWLKTGANSAFTASINGVASVLVSAQGFIAKE